MVLAFWSWSKDKIWENNSPNKIIFEPVLSSQGGKKKHSTGNPREEILLDQDKHSDSSAEESNQNVMINDKLNEVTW